MFFRMSIFYSICLLILSSMYILNTVGLFQFSRISIDDNTENLVISPREASIFSNCSHRYKVAFTFDDGPHPITTPIIVKTLNEHRIKGGFFVLGTSIQSYLSARNILTVHQFERPSLPFLLLQNYSSLDLLFSGHDIYLHGWLHERNEEMRLQTVVNNIAIQLIEIGHLKAFKPIYRAPWGIPTTPKHVKDNVLLVQILKQMGITAAYWDIDTKDWQQQVNENTLISSSLKMICKKKGGHILMHDNRPTTAYFLDRFIRSIKDSGHTIVSPAQINSIWNDKKAIVTTRKYIEVLRKRVRNAQRNQSKNINHRKSFHPVEISLGTTQIKLTLLRNIYPTDPHKDTVNVSPNINNI